MRDGTMAPASPESTGSVPVDIALLTRALQAVDPCEARDVKLKRVLGNIKRFLSAPAGELVSVRSRVRA